MGLILIVGRSAERYRFLAVAGAAALQCLMAAIPVGPAAAGEPLYRDLRVGLMGGRALGQFRGTIDADTQGQPFRFVATGGLGGRGLMVSAPLWLDLRSLGGGPNSGKWSIGLELISTDIRARVSAVAEEGIAFLTDPLTLDAKVSVDTTSVFLNAAYRFIDNRRARVYLGAGLGAGSSRVCLVSTLSSDFLGDLRDEACRQGKSRAVQAFAGTDFKIGRHFSLGWQTKYVRYGHFAGQANRTYATFTALAGVGYSFRPRVEKRQGLPNPDGSHGALRPEFGPAADFGDYSLRVSLGPSFGSFTARLTTSDDGKPILVRTRGLFGGVGTVANLELRRRLSDAWDIGIQTGYAWGSNRLASRIDASFLTGDQVLTPNASARVRWFEILLNTIHTRRLSSSLEAMVGIGAGVLTGSARVTNLDPAQQLFARLDTRFTRLACHPG